ncbi:hypothetical protein LOTGIDRAFT_163551 [Lottia gigantea]|uniref:DUF19 domain-containing protein n=1 Tax=Lottia gigantea TaxID=225164 RepID=V3ZIC8_LOTGI|nr:hypothetical protein LOTGIDRAFT_163551 [Lottia gigantea]ESO91033.1 hypothetical protein LOTGIDRAFT_163551 [Lottia gigantea]
MNLGTFLFLLLQAGYQVNGQINSNNAYCPSFAPNKIQCNNDHQVPGLPALSMTVLSNFHTLNKSLLCGQTPKAQFKEAARCLFKSYSHCGDNDFKGLVTKISKFEEAVDLVCSRSDLVDHYASCIGDSVIDCIRNREAREKLTTSDVPSRDEQFNEFVHFYCRKREIEEECIFDDEDVDACSSSSTVPTFRELRLLMKPPACSSSGLMSSITVVIFYALVGLCVH